MPSHHLLRRTARKRARALTRIEDQRLALEGGERRWTYRVEKAQRGPWRWRVVEITTIHMQARLPES